MSTIRSRFGAVVAVAGIFIGCASPAPQNAPPANPGSVQHLNPAGLHKNPAYSQAVVVSGNVQTIYVGGQNAVDTTGNVIGKGDIKAQTQQVLRNVETALTAAGAKLEHVIKWNVHIVQGQPLAPGFEAFQQAWANRPNPPLVTMSFVSALANPDYLVEIEAVAVVPIK